MLAILIARFAALASRLAGNEGTSLPGMLATKIDSKILNKLSSEISRGIVLVTGTNGKTTTANITTKILEDAGYRVISNKIGANMYNGIASAFLLEAPLTGHLQADYAVLEVDELYTVPICKDLTPKYFVVTNLFPDQIDRMGSIEDVRAAINRALKHTISSDTTLVLNLDNPDSAQLSKMSTREIVFFSVTEPVDYHASDITEDDTLSFIAHTPDTEAPFVTNMRGLYNVSNILGALVVTTGEGISLEDSAKTLADYQTQPGRMERFVVEGKPVIINMAKNPAGFNYSLESANNSGGTFDVYFVTNNTVADGVDIDWYEHIELEQYEKEGPRNFYVGGDCSDDMAQRLRDAGINWNRIRIVQPQADGIHKALQGSGDTLYVIANYSAVFPLRKELLERADVVSEPA